MPDPPFDKGDTIRIRTAVTDADTASPLAPSVIGLRVENPSGLVATYLSTGASPPQIATTGIYYVDYTLAAAGSYAWRWETTFPNSAEEGVFYTAPTNF